MIEDGLLTRYLSLLVVKRDLAISSPFSEKEQQEFCAGRWELGELSGEFSEEDAMLMSLHLASTLEKIMFCSGAGSQVVSFFPHLSMPLCYF